MPVWSANCDGGGGCSVGGSLLKGAHNLTARAFKRDPASCLSTFVRVARVRSLAKARGARLEAAPAYEPTSSRLAAQAEPARSLARGSRLLCCDKRVQVHADAERALECQQQQQQRLRPGKQPGKPTWLPQRAAWLTNGGGGGAATGCCLIVAAAFPRRRRRSCCCCRCCCCVHELEMYKNSEAANKHVY